MNVSYTSRPMGKRMLRALVAMTEALLFPLGVSVAQDYEAVERPDPPIGRPTKCSLRPPKFTEVASSSADCVRTQLASVKETSDAWTGINLPRRDPSQKSFPRWDAAKMTS